MTNLHKTIKLMLRALLLDYDANYDHSGTLRKTGDYLITVARPTESKGTSRCKLLVTVR